MHTTLRLGRFVLRIHWPIAAGVILVVVGLARLGVWQLERAQDRIEQQRAFQAAGQQAPTPLDEVPIAGIEYDALQHQNRRVVLHGAFLNERNILLIYQSFEDQIGWEVITPLLLDDASQVALVSRGWSGIGDVDALAAALPAITGEVEIEGQLFVPTPEQAARRGDALSETWPRVQRHLNIDELAPLFDRPLFPYVVRLADDQPGVLVRHWPLVLVDSGRNFSYALQWFAMAISVAAASVFLGSNAAQLWRERKKEPSSTL
ncbi:MAG TPA: SURF1 family protein [Pseudomonadales bacterium]